MEGLYKSVLYSEKVKRQLKGKQPRKSDLTGSGLGSFFLTDSEVNMMSNSKSLAPLYEDLDLTKQENYLVREERTNSGKLVQLFQKVENPKTQFGSMQIDFPSEVQLPHKIAGDFTAELSDSDVLFETPVTRIETLLEEAGTPG